MYNLKKCFNQTDESLLVFQHISYLHDKIIYEQFNSEFDH